MKTCAFDDYKVSVTTAPRPVWFTSERYDFCEQEAAKSVFEKLSEKVLGRFQTRAL